MAGLAADLAAALDAVQLARQVGLEPDAWQAQVLRSRSLRLLLNCCRQSGKSTITAVLAMHTALYQAPALVLLLSPSLRQSVELFRKVLDAYEALGRPLPADAESVLRLELPNGSRLVALPGKEATIRGFSGVRLLIIDEASRVDDALYQACRPMLSVSGGRLVALSTPFGKRGFFFHEWTEGAAWERVQITAEQCPRIPPEFLAEERRALPDAWYAQEYLCEFRETTDQVFAYEHVQAALSPDVAPLFPLGGEP
jgi:hypothetical protein